MNWFRRLFMPRFDRIELEQREAVNTLYVNSASKPVRHERSLTVRRHDFTTATNNCRNCGVPHEMFEDGQSPFCTMRKAFDQEFGRAYRATERYSPGWFDPRTGKDTRRPA